MEEYLKAYEGSEMEQGRAVALLIRRFDVATVEQILTEYINFFDDESRLSVAEQLAEYMESCVQMERETAPICAWSADEKD